MHVSDLNAFDRLPAAQRIRLVQELWDRIAEHPDDVGVSDEQLDELLRRVEEDDQEPEAAIPWDQARKLLRSSRR